MRNLENFQNKQEIGQEVSEKKKEFKAFLKEQISLPRKEWGDRFKEYISEKIKEKADFEREGEEKTPEEWQKKDFSRYLKSLEFSPEDLRSKRILDLGCGPEGNFVKTLMEKGITDQAFGLDHQIRAKKLEEKYRKNFFKSNFNKKLPIDDLDYVFSVGAVEASSDDKDKRSPKKILVNSLKSLKEEGEIRIFPIRKAPPESDLKGIDYMEEKWKQVLEEVQEKENIDYKIEPIDITVGGNKPDVWLEQVLIVKKMLKEKNINKG